MFIFKCVCVCYLQGSCPPRAVWAEEGCEHLRGTSYRRNLLQHDHSWRRSMNLNKPESFININAEGVRSTQRSNKKIRLCDFSTLMSVHLNTLLLPVGIVGLTWTPMSVCYRGEVQPPVKIKQTNCSIDLFSLWYKKN